MHDIPLFKKSCVTFFCRKILCFLFFFCHILKSVFLLAFDTHICIVVCCVLLYCCFAVRSCIVCEFTFVATLFCIVCTFKLLAHAVASFANLHFLLLHCLCIYRFATHCCIICEFTFIPRVVTLFASLLFFFFTQQVLNMVTAVAEICDTQSAMNILGYESEISSHKFVYLHAWSAVGYQNKLGHNRLCDCHLTDGSEKDLFDREDGSATEDEEFETDLQDNRESGSRNQRTMYVGHNGEVHAISQHELYLNRVENWDAEYIDPGVTSRDGYEQRKWRNLKTWKQRATLEQQCGLKNMSLLQFVMHVTVKKLPPTGKLNPKNTASFRLHKNSPLHRTHYLQLTKEPRIPILAGKSRPCPPAHKKPHNGRAERRWKARADQFARYMGALMFPWNRDGDCGVHNWDQLQQKVVVLKQGHNDRKGHARENLYCDAFHLQYMNNVASNMRCDEQVQRTSHVWNSEFAHRFERNCERDACTENSNDHTYNINTTLEDIRKTIAQASAAQCIAAASTDAAKTKDFLTKVSESMDELYSDTDGIVHKQALKFQSTNKNGHEGWSKYPKDWVCRRRSALNKNTNVCEEIRGEESFGVKRSLSTQASLEIAKIQKRLSVNPDWVRVFNYVTETWLQGEQLLLFVHGGPGTGKTTIAKAIMELAGIFNLESRYSATSGVAGLLNDGTTIHHLLAQNGELSSHKPNVTKIRQRVGNAQVILVDEVRRTDDVHNLWACMIQTLL